jgi:hypothetical protein
MKKNSNIYHSKVLLPEIKKTIEQERKEKLFQEERSIQHIKNMDQQEKIKEMV